MSPENQREHISELDLVRIHDAADNLVSILFPIVDAESNDLEGIDQWRNLYWKLYGITTEITSFLANAPPKCGNFEVVDALEELTRWSLSHSEDPETGSGAIRICPDLELPKVSPD